LIGMRDRAMYAVAALAAAAFAFPAIAAAESAEEGAVVESPAPSPEGPWSHWTRERLEQAEPLPIVTLPEPASPTEPESESASSFSSSEAPSAPQSEGATTAALRSATTGQTAATEGVEVGAAESTVLPSSANGKVFGSYYIRLGAHEFEREDYVCSGTVVNSPHGDVILTAGHCAVEPETGTPTSSELIFIPGYRKGSAPFGTWKIESYAIPETWKNTAKAGSRPNEGGDLAFIELQDNDEGESVEEAVGSFGVGFDQPCEQTYTQFGYPAESPYSGELLYSHTAAYAGADTSGGFTPVPMKIASDFTRGASGGPWAIGVGTSMPTVLSLTAYGYESQPGYLYGPYFGEAAKKTYSAAIKRTLSAGIEEACTALPVVPENPIETPKTPPVSPTPTPTPTPQPESTPAAAPVKLKVTRVRRRANGSAVLTALVNTAGMLKLSGTAVRAESLDTHAAGQYRLIVAPKRPTSRLLLQRGRAKVGVKVAFIASGRTKRVSRAIQLSRRAVAQPTAQSR
jgi:hypothetical protein